MKDFHQAEFYSVEQAFEHAKRYCEENKGWQPVSEIPDLDSLYLTWKELSKEEKSEWLQEYGSRYAENAWEAFGAKICRYPYGFISGKGEFYKDVLDIPLYHNHVMVIKTERLT